MGTIKQVELERQFGNMKFEAHPTGDNVEFPGLELIAKVQDADGRWHECTAIRMEFDLEAREWQILYWGPRAIIEDSPEELLLELPIDSFPENFLKQYAELREPSGA